MDCYNLVLQVLTLCAVAASGLPLEVARWRILSAATGGHLAITKSGRVHANVRILNPNPDKDASRMIVQHLNRGNQIRVASVKYSSGGRYLVVTPDGLIRAQVPEGGNEIIERILLHDGCFVYKFANYRRIVDLPAEEEGSGSASETLVPGSAGSEEACYLGFNADNRGRAECYSDVNHPNVRLHEILILN